MSGRAQTGGRPRRRDARKGTQRERLLQAMVEVSASEGYGAVTIGRLIARAGVSRPTFYDYFRDTEDCLLAAMADVQGRLSADVRRAVDDRAGRDALRAATQSVTAFAESEPAMSQVLMSEAMAGGPRALDVRDRGIGEIERLVESTYEKTPRGTPAPDVSAGMLIGGLYRLLARRLRRGKAVAGDLGEELGAWVKSYERPLGEHRWRGLSPSPPAVLQPAYPPLLRPIAPAGRRARPSREETSRERILFAAAEIAEQKGYAGATIAAITKRAGIDHRAFHRAFVDRQEVIGALHELFFQHLMTVSVSAFFAQASWPERVWQAGLAFTGAAEQNPTLAHVAFVEGQAAGPAAVQRFEDLVNAFTIFLEQGYEGRTEGDRPSTAALEAIAWTTHEVGYTQSRARGEGQIVGLLPHVTFLALTPFLGAVAADELIDQKLGVSREPEGPPAPPRRQSAKRGGG